MTGQNSITAQITLQMAHRILHQTTLQILHKILHKILHRITHRIIYTQMNPPKINPLKINGATLLTTASYPPNLETQSQVYQYTLPIICSQASQPYVKRN
jgi:hypothetical protein